MTLRQLRALQEVVKQGLRISATADYADNEKRLLYRTMIKVKPTH